MRAWSARALKQRSTLGMAVVEHRGRDSRATQGIMLGDVGALELFTCPAEPSRSTLERHFEEVVPSGLLDRASGDMGDGGEYWRWGQMKRPHKRRQRVLRIAVAVGVTLMGAATAIVALFHPVWAVSRLLLGGSQALALGSAILGYVEQLHHDRTQMTSAERGLAEGLLTRPRTLLLTDPCRAGVVQESRCARRFQHPVDAPPPAVCHEVHGPLRAAFADAATRRILVDGMAPVGKDCSTFEAAAAAAPNHWLVAPRSFRGLRWFRDPRPPCPDDAPVLFWLDDLRLFVRPAGLPSQWLEEWANPASKIKVVGLARTDQLDDLCRPGEVHQPLRDVLARFREVGPGVSLTVRRSHDHEECAEVARHIDRLRNSEQTCPAGFLVVWACALAQHLLREREISEAQLVEVYQLGLGRRPSTRRLTIDQFEVGVGFAVTGLLRVRNSSGMAWYSAPQHLVEYVVEHLLEPEWRTLGVPDDMWTAVLHGADEFDGLTMGLVAYDQGRPERAEAAWTRALRSGSSAVHTNAAISLAELRREAARRARSSVERQRALEEAARLLDRARRAADPCEGARARRVLGEVMTDLRAFQPAAATYLAAMSSGHPDEVIRATWRLGTLFRDHLDDQETARHLLQRAADSGHYDVAPRAARDLGVFLPQPQEGASTTADMNVAIDPLQRPARSESRDHTARPSIMLVEVLRGRRPEAAATVDMQALQLDEFAVALHVALRLGELLLSQRQPDRALAMLQRVQREWPGRPTPIQTRQPAALLAGCGDLTGARDAYQHAIYSTNDGPVAAKAAGELGRLELRQGNVAGGRSSLEVAIDRGRDGDDSTVVAAVIGLADVLLLERDPAESADRYVTAMRHLLSLRLPEGHGHGPINLSPAGRDPLARARAVWVTALGQAVKAGHPSVAADAAARLGQALLARSADETRV
jgi:Tetratricopeptide repeat